MKKLALIILVALLASIAMTTPANAAVYSGGIEKQAFDVWGMPVLVRHDIVGKTKVKGGETRRVTLQVDEIDHLENNCLITDIRVRLYKRNGALLSDRENLADLCRDNAGHRAGDHGGTAFGIITYIGRPTAYRTVITGQLERKGLGVSDPDFRLSYHR